MDGIDDESTSLLSGLRSETLERLARGAPLAEILETIARGIERTSPGSIASIHLVRDGRLYNAASPSLPRAYIDAMEGLVIGPRVGSCGSSAYLATRVVTEHIENDPRWRPFLTMTRAFGLASCWSQPILDSRGVVVGTFGIYRRAPAKPTARDLFIVEAAAELAAITIEKSQAEEALRTSERRLSLALRGANEGLWEFDLRTKSYFFSPRYARILGYEPGAIAPDRDAWAALIHPADQRLPDEEFARVLRDGADTFAAEFRMRHRDGDWRTILSRAHVVQGADGQPEKLVGTILDITEHRRTQLELEAALEAAQAANQAKSEFLAMMSHELRTPLHAILGMSELLLDAALDATSHHYAEIIRNSASSLRDIIRDILDTSRIEAGKVELERVPFDLRDLLAGFVDLNALRAHSKGVAFYEVIAPAVPTMVLGDPARLRQILDNLASNALKFTTAGTITFEVRCDPGDDEAALRFIFRDTGVGIPDEARARLFQPFVQLDASTSRSFDGTGLGLLLARQLAALMDGALDLEESAPGVGSTFVLRCALPLARDAKPARPRPPAVAARVAALATTPAFAASLRAHCATLRAGFEVVDDAAALARRGECDRRPTALVLESGAPPAELPPPPSFAVDAGWRTVLVLEPSGSPLAEAALALGWDACLLRPFRCDALARALTGDGDGSQAQAHEHAHEDPAAARRRAATILLVEDNLVNREVAIAMLQALGVTHIDHAEDGAVAIEKATATTYDLILMDYVMPRVDGIEATRRLREQGYRAPIVATTANALERERLRGVAAGIDAFATKPLGLQRLAQILDRWLGAAAPGRA
ncbi:MAG: ATP-binding protein [Nannocystaceae bacterium]